MNARFTRERTRVLGVYDQFPEDRTSFHRLVRVGRLAKRIGASQKRHQISGGGIHKELRQDGKPLEGIDAVQTQCRKRERLLKGLQ